MLAQHADASMPETSQLKLKDHHKYCKMLRDKPFFAAFTEMETEKILATAEVAEFSAGQRIIAEGSEAHWLFLLVEGSAVATLDMACSMAAASSLPVPLSPRNSTVAWVGATRSTNTCRRLIAAERPMIRGMEAPPLRAAELLLVASSCLRSVAP